MPRVGLTWLWVWSGEADKGDEANECYERVEESKVRRGHHYGSMTKREGRGCEDARERGSES